jgi:hypothetical protein
MEETRQPLNSSLLDAQADLVRKMQESFDLNRSVEEVWNQAIALREACYAYLLLRAAQGDGTFPLVGKFPTSIDLSAMSHNPFAEPKIVRHRGGRSGERSGLKSSIP